MNFMPIPTKRYRLKRDDRITIDGVDYRRAKSDENGHLLCRAGDPDVTEFFTHAEFHRLFAEERLVVFGDWYRHGAAEVRALNNGISVCDLDPEERAHVFLRKALLDRILTTDQTTGRVPRSDDGLSRFVRSVWNEIVEAEAKKNGKTVRFGEEVPAPPKPTSVRRLLTRYRATGFDALALRDSRHRSGNRKPRLPPEVYAVAEPFIQTYASSIKPTKALLLAQYETALVRLNTGRIAQGLTPIAKMGRRTFEAAIDRLDPWRVVAAREGIAAAQGKFGAARAGSDIVRPGQRIEIDECLLDLHALLVRSGDWDEMTQEKRELVKRVRVWVTVAIDVRTKCIMGMVMHVDAPSANTAVACLEMTTLDKTELAKRAGSETPWDMFGRGETYGSDTGAALKSNRAHAAVLALKAEYIHPPVKKPHLRGPIERFFKTIQRSFIPFFTGQTWGNVVEKGDYDSQANASLFVEEVWRLLVRWAADVYHNTPHEGLGGATPRGMWLQLNEHIPIMAPPGTTERRHIFGKRVRRQIQKRGIRVLGIQYHSPELQQLRRLVGQDYVEVNVDPFDLGAISVCTGKDWIRVPQSDARVELTGVTFWEWKAAAEDLRRKHLNMAKLSAPVVQRAIEDIRAASDNAIERNGQGSPVMSDNAFEKVEKDLFATFDYMPIGDADAIGSIEDAAAYRLDDLNAFDEPESDTELKAQPTPELHAAVAEDHQPGNPAAAEISPFSWDEEE